MLKGVERADVVEMAVSECGPFDRAARLRGGRYQVIGGTARLFVSPARSALPVRETQLFHRSVNHLDQFNKR